MNKYEEQSNAVKQFTGQPLLESLEELNGLSDDDWDDVPDDVTSAFRCLMIAFGKMFNG